MKKIVFSLVFFCIAMLCLLPTFAADTVVFVADGGTGDGTAATAPLGTLADAYAVIGSGNGTIVICGKYTVGNTSTVSLPAHDGAVTFTSVYGGVDYTATNMAELYFNGTSFLKLNGATVFDNIKMTLKGSAAGICCNFNPVTVGEGVVINTATYKMYLVVGPNGDSAGTLTADEVLEINVFGGKFINVTAFSRSVAATNSGTVILNIGGNADIRDLCPGSLSAGSYAGAASVNLGESAKVTNLYLGGYNSKGMQGDVSLSVADNAAISAIKNYGDTYFPESERYLNVYSENVSLPDAYAACFDRVTTYEDNADVIFVCEDKNGDGSSPLSPVGSLTEAFGLVGEGGKIVLTGTASFPNKTMLQLPACTGEVTLTSVHGGNDYRKLCNAAFGFTGTSFVCFNGDIVLDDITAKIGSSTVGFCFNFHNAYIGEGFEIEEPSGYHLFVLGGTNSDTALPALAKNKAVSITILSGRYHTLSGYTRRVTNVSHEGTVTVNLGGDAEVNAYSVGPISTGARGGESIVNLSDAATVNTMYLGGYQSGAMNGSVTVNIGDTATVKSILNYNSTYFASTKKNLNIQSAEASLPENYTDIFDNITTVLQAYTVTLPLPEDAPDISLAQLLVNGETAVSSVSGSAVAFESIEKQATLSLTYKDSVYRRIVFDVDATSGTAVATLANDTTYDGSVIYVADGASGDGLTVDSPVGTLTSAHKAMLTAGGTVVLCGEVTVPAKITLPSHEETVTYTSVYGSSDYREHARLFFPNGMTVLLGGDSVFTDINIHTTTYAFITAGFHTLTFDTGVVTTAGPEAEGLKKSEGANGLYLAGGYNGASIGEVEVASDANITLRSGFFRRVYGFSRLSGKTTYTGTATILLEGTAEVDELIVGATGNSATAKNAHVTVKDNAIIWNLFACGRETDNYLTGQFDLVVYGGDIYEIDALRFYATKCPMTFTYDVRTVPSGYPYLAEMAQFDVIQTFCERDNTHSFSEPYASEFDASILLSVCSVCGELKVIGDVPESTDKNVVFVAEGGYGDGRHPSVPTSDLYAAFAKLSSGGTIVIMNSYTLSANTTQKVGSAPSFFQEPMHEGTVTVTSVYGGIDYRKQGAKLTFNGNIDYKLSGPVTFENIIFDATEKTTVNNIAARYNALKFGKDVTMLRTKEDGYSLNLVGGYLYFRYTDFADVVIEENILDMVSAARPLTINAETGDYTIDDPENIVTYGETSNFVLHAEAARAFNRMFADMSAAGLKEPTRLSFAWRGYLPQYDGYTKNIGIGRLDYGYTFEQAHRSVIRHCATPGTSEHHIGYAMDFHDEALGDDAHKKYDQTAEWAWILQNGYKYGIILRYPSNDTATTGFSYEAWHFRYVGIEHATAIAKLNAGGDPEGNAEMLLTPTWCLEEYVGMILGMYDKDAYIEIVSGDFDEVTVGSVGCDSLPFTGEGTVLYGEAPSGDANGDERISLTDVIRILRYSTDSAVTISEEADMNRDGKIDLSDALLLIRKILNS